MVFEPAFEEIDEQAAELPDLGGDGPEEAEPAIGASDSDDGEPEAEAEGVVADAGAEVAEDELPPYGAE
jgi:hypothetical protein